MESVIETVKEHCPHKDCMYRAKLDNVDDYCAYCLFEHQPRNCRISKCNRYRKGKRKIVIEGGTLDFRWVEDVE